MKAVNIAERVVLLLLAIPAVFIVIDAVLRVFNADLLSSAVRFVLNTDDKLTPDFLDTIFQDPFTIGRLDVQTALLNLAFYGVLVLAVVFLFRLIRSLVSGMSRSARSTSQNTGDTSDTGARRA